MTEVTLKRPDATLVGTDRGRGPVALLLHAAGERRHVWRDTAEALAARGFRTVAYDQRGHGDSTAVTADRLPAFGEDVARMIRSLGTMPVVVGASLGGLAAMLALQDPTVRAEVAGLVVVDIVPDPDRQRIRELLVEKSRTLDSSPLIANVFRCAATLRKAAASLDLPTLLVRGGAGSPISDADVERFTDLVPHARVNVIGRSGHLVARDAPVELAEQIAAHLVDPEVRRRRIGQQTAGNGVTTRVAGPAVRGATPSGRLTPTRQSTAGPPGRLGGAGRSSARPRAAATRRGTGRRRAPR